MGIVKDHQLAISKTLDVGLNPARADAGRCIKGCMGVLGIRTTRAAVSADLLVGKIRFCQLDARPYP